MNSDTITLLLLEDDPAFADVLRQLLPQAVQGPVHIQHATTLRDALSALQQKRFDVLLLDLNVPDSAGKPTFSALLPRAREAAVIILTGSDDETLATEAVREGAQDYLLKAQLDARILGRVIRYAIERKRAEETLRDREEFFRLISENVNDLIAVIDQDGRRLYNSPSYLDLLGEPEGLKGTNSFNEIHPDDRARVEQLFRHTIETGRGLRADYRLIGKDGAVRHIESRGNVIRHPNGGASKVVVVSRDITDRKEAMKVLDRTLADLNKSHQELKVAQLQAVEAEKLEAVSTFAAGVAHEVKNPLQTIILGVDYLSNHLKAADNTTSGVLTDMAEAVHRADAIIRGLIEFSAYSKRTVKDEDLSAIIEQSLHAVQVELANCPIQVSTELARDLPPLRVDLRTLKHVFINLFMYCVRAMPQGGSLRVRTSARQLAEPLAFDGKPLPHFKPGETVLLAEVEDSADHTMDRENAAAAPGACNSVTGLGLTVLRKIIELYGGVIHIDERSDGSRFTIVFRAAKG